MELLMGLEPMTSSLPRKCSTTELQQPVERAESVRQESGDGVRRASLERDPSDSPGSTVQGSAARAWSGRWESNPRYQLGRLKFYH
jgi:hypothetical protein